MLHIDDSGAHFIPDEKDEAPSPPGKEAPLVAQATESEDTCGRTVLPHSPRPTPCICRVGHEGPCVYLAEARSMNRARDKVKARRADAERWAGRADSGTCDHGRLSFLFCGACEFERQRAEVELNQVYES